jgi:hypothetical protein
MAKSSGQPGIVKLDFARYFPHKFWISDWSEDDEYPEGFRYKVLGVRDEEEQAVELVLLLEERNGSKQEVHRALVKVAAADGYARVFVDGLEEEHGLDFEEQDFTAVRTAEQFDRAVTTYGWSGREPEAEPGASADGGGR